MSEFIVGHSIRKLARKHNALRQLLWRIDFVLVWMMIQLVRLLPVDTASRVGQRIGSWIGPRLTHKNDIYTQNLRKAFPERSEREIDSLVRLSWGRVGRVMAEYPHLDKILRDPERLQIDILEPMAACDGSGRPCVIVTAHLSNWEVVCSAMAKLGMPNASLYSPPTNPLLDKMLREQRRALNCTLLPRDNSARGLIRAMKKGITAGMVIDRRVDEGQAISFFGMDKNSTLMPARLALMFDCDLVPVQVERLQDARYRVTFHPPVVPAAHCADDQERATDMIQQVHRQFEEWIRARPEDWFCSKRLWPKGKIKQTREDGRDADIDSYAA